MLGHVFKSTFRNAGLGVPRRLPLGELMLLVTIFAAVFQVLSLIRVPGAVVLCIGIFTLGVAFCQAMMFGGQRPRDASMIAGIVLCPVIFLLARVFDYFVNYALGDPTLPTLGFIRFFTIAALLGPFLGYFVGLFIAGWFYSFDYCRSRLTGASRRSHEAQWENAQPGERLDQTEPDPSAKPTDACIVTHDNKSTWLKRFASHFWPIRPSQPMRGAVGAFLSSLVCCLIFAPAFQLGYWNIAAVLAVALTAAFLTGMFQLPWYCIAITVAVSVVTCQWEIRHLRQLAVELSLDDYFDDRALRFVSFLLSCLASAIACCVIAVVGWLRLIRNRLTTRTTSNSPRKKIHWILATASVAGGLIAPLAYKLTIDAFANSPRISVARRISANGGKVHLIATPPTLSGWPKSSGVSIEKNSLTSLQDYLATFPETIATSHVSILQRDLDSSSLTPLDGSRMSSLALLNTQSDHALDNIKDFTVGYVIWRNVLGERMKAGDNSLAQLARMPGVQGTLKTLFIWSGSVTNIQPIENLTSLTRVIFNDCPIASGSVRFAVPMPSIVDASFGRCPINNDDLQQIVAAMPNLNSLDISETQITDEGLGALAKLKKLSTLNLSLTEITDEGLRHLENIPGLELLYLQQTNVSRGATEDLTDKLEIEIDWEAKQPEE